MAKKIRARCPLCGLIADVDRFGENWEVDVFLQTFGGKKPGGAVSPGLGKGSNPGHIEYKNITDTAEGRRVISMIQKKIESKP